MFIKNLFFKTPRSVVMPLLIIMICVFIGAGLNDLVIKVNGDKMPVYSSWYFNQTSRHKHFNDYDYVNLPYFSDIIELKNSVISVGDLFLMFAYYYSMGILIIYVFYIFYQGTVLSLSSLLSKKIRQKSI